MESPEVKKARSSYQLAVARAERIATEQRELGADKLTNEHDVALAEAMDLADQARERLEHVEATERARAKFERAPLEDTKVVPLASGGLARISVDEPDMYGPQGRSFFVDLFGAQIKGDVAAQQRIAKHHAYEVERYAVQTGTLGGVIPPQYLVELYAKAQRFGRVTADQCRRMPLPDVGMSLIVPRLTVGTAAGIQASENSAVTTQDPTETDLTVPVRTVAGYSPVSRQTLERAAYSDVILMEDLVARYQATLDSQILNGSGSSGQHLGILNTSGTSSSAISSFTAANAWAAIAGESGVIAAINLWAATVGAPCDRLIMHPRRWAAFLGLLDSSNRPLIVPDAGSGIAFNAMATGETAAYGLAGRLAGVAVYTDANIPTNLGGGTNQDVIVAMASQAVLLWERDDDPVTLAFEQQAGTSLQVQLIAYGYSAFTAGRYPAAVGVVSGAGLT